MPDELSRLKSAASVLARVYTREDHQVGFVVEMGATPGWFSGVSQSEFIEAWATVREILHLPHEPPKTAADPD